MITVVIAPFAVDTNTDEPRLVVRYRAFRDSKWLKNGFWLFSLPVDVSDLFDRAYIELEADNVYFQDTFLNTQELNETYSSGSHKPLT
jgi:hypothetical protein